MSKLIVECFTTVNVQWHIQLTLFSNAVSEKKTVKIDRCIFLQKLLISFLNIQGVLGRNAVKISGRLESVIEYV